MGQIFYASAYDTEKRECCVAFADKFAQYCYHDSPAVCSMHYLLRQKPFRVMWGGGHMITDDRLDQWTEIEDLLGLSTYLKYEDFRLHVENLEEKSYYNKVRFIDQNAKCWNRMDVREEALAYFKKGRTSQVRYEGWLVSHSQKQAVDLADYCEQSRGMTDGGTETVIDVIPVLTETGGGTEMALYDGMSADTTESLIGMWCGDMLQIVDQLPAGYEVIGCCFAHIWDRCKYCFAKFGADEEGYVRKDDSGNRYEAAVMLISRRRGTTAPIRIKIEEDRLIFTFRPVSSRE